MARVYARGANQRDTHARLAVYADKILKGARPQAASALGLTIPQSLLLLADRVIQ